MRRVAFWWQDVHVLEMSAYLCVAVLAYGAVGLLGVTLRVAVLHAGGPPIGGSPQVEDYGLLRPIADVPTLDLGHCVGALLRGSGVRSTVVTGRDGRIRVLVFADEYDRAQRLVSWAL
jgi:hypothetical protein